MVSNQLSVRVRTPAEPHHTASHTESERLRQFIVRYTVEFKFMESDLYFIHVSEEGTKRMEAFLTARIDELNVAFSFDDLNQEGKIDWFLMLRYCKRKQGNCRRILEVINEINQALGPWVQDLVRLCEQHSPISARETASVLHAAIMAMEAAPDRLWEREGPLLDRSTAFKAVDFLNELRQATLELDAVRVRVDPSWSWWVRRPLDDFDDRIQLLCNYMSKELTGIRGGRGFTVASRPFGRDGIQDQLDAGMIAYSPEELITIAERQYTYHEQEMIKISHELGFGDDWRKAMDHIKEPHVDPSQQPILEYQQMQEAVRFVQQHDMVTVPDIAVAMAKETSTPRLKAARDTTRDTRQSSRLMGETVCPTVEMRHDTKLTYMRENNPLLSRSRVVLEMIPGRRLQAIHMCLYRKYRGFALDHCWTRGWDFYWLSILRGRGFFASPEDRLASQYRHLWTCLWASNILKFHLGKVTARQLTRNLTSGGARNPDEIGNWVVATMNEEPEILGAIGGFLGDLQYHALRKEVVDTGMMREKEFHDRILMENTMPIELLRALLRDEPITAPHKPTWRFDDV